MKRLFYITAVDVGAPTGPGVNEGSFWEAAKRQAGFEFCPLFVKTNPSGSVRRRGWLGKGLAYLSGQLRGFLGAVSFRMRARSGDICFVRAGILPIGIAAGMVFSARKVHLKTVGDLDIIVAEFGEMFPGALRAAVHAVNLLLWRNLFSHASSADACTPELRGIVISLFGEEFLPPIWVIPNSVSADRFARVGRARQPGGGAGGCVGYLGGAPLERGGKSVIDLVSEAPLRSLDLHGLVAGSHGPQLLAYAMQRGVAGKVEICGLVAPDQVPRLMGRVDVGLAMDGGSRHDRVGNSYQKVSQYLAAGCAVVTTRVSDEAIARLANVRVVPPDDMDSLFKAVSSLLARPPEDVAAAVRQAIDFVESERSNDGLVRRRLELIAGLPDGHRQERASA